MRPALISAGISILETEGLAALSLRKVAALAGVSHAAPAHHFVAKNGLLMAIAIEGFRTFSRLMEEARAAATPDPRAQLLGICEGYLTFADTHEALFQLFFPQDIKQEAASELSLAAHASFRVLADTCAPFKPSPNHL